MMLLDKQAVSVSGAFEIKFEDGTAATIEVAELSLNELLNPRTELALGTDYPDVRHEDYPMGWPIASFTRGTPYLTVNARLAPVDTDPTAAMVTIRTEVKP